MIVDNTVKNHIVEVQPSQIVEQDLQEVRLAGEQEQEQTLAEQYSWMNPVDLYMVNTPPDAETYRYLRKIREREAFYESAIPYVLLSFLSASFGCLFF